jgi:1,2-phenylacetyl-CoA epoxidase PaaB subunit
MICMSQSYDILVAKELGCGHAPDAQMALKQMARGAFTQRPIPGKLSALANQVVGRKL